MNSSSIAVSRIVLMDAVAEGAPAAGAPLSDLENSELLRELMAGTSYAFRSSTRRDVWMWTSCRTLRKARSEIADARVSSFSKRSWI